MDKVERIPKEQLKLDYTTLANFLGFSYIPFEADKNIAGWFSTKVDDSTHDKIIYERFITRNTLKLNFLFDWSMLMLVVEKIESLQSNYHGGFKVIISDDECIIQSRNRGKENSYSVSYCSPNNKKRSVYESCLRFLNYCKENKLN